MALRNTLITFTITTTIAVLTLALSQNITSLYLLPLCIIIPMSIRIVYYGIGIAKLSAYMIVFLENDLDGIKWETRNFSIINIDSKLSMKNLVFLRNYQCLFLSLICYGLYVFDYIKDKEITLMTIFNLVWPLLFIILEMVITHYINSVDKERAEWIKKWKNIKIETQPPVA